MIDRSIQEVEEMGGAKYINPYTDFGFKKLFGTPLNKDLLISFLNSLFEGREVIHDLTYLNGECWNDEIIQKQDYEQQRNIQRSERAARLIASAYHQG